MKNNKRKDMPSWNQIKEYWSGTSLFQIKGVKDISTNFCFACLADCYSTKLERSHIQAICVGGNNEVSNIHLLCNVCHKDSEYLGGNSTDTFPMYPDKTQEAYWQWLFERDADKAAFSSWIRGGWSVSYLNKLKPSEGRKLIAKILDIYKYNTHALKKLKPIFDEADASLEELEIIEMIKEKGFSVRQENGALIFDPARRSKPVQAWLPEFSTSTVRS